MRAIQATVHRGGRVRLWLQTEAGERVYATMEDAAFSDGYLDGLARAVEAALRAAAPEPGRRAIHGRPAVSGPENRSEPQA